MSPEKSPLRTDHEPSGEVAEMVAQFDQKPFWRQVVLLSAGLLWYLSTRILLPVIAVALVVAIAF